MVLRLVGQCFLWSAIIVSSAGFATSTTQTLGEWAYGLRAIVASGAANTSLVSGNEGADADSIISALTYGYLLHHQSLGGWALGSGPTVPLVQCNREDMALRGETTLLLAMCGVDWEDLVFLNDPNVDTLLSRARRLTLTDHNKATGPLVALGDKVMDIHDHHQDKGAHMQAPVRVIAFEDGHATAGSCCSVIAEAYQQSGDMGLELLKRDSGAVARALEGVILLDTVDLDPDQHKVCPRDIAAASVLRNITPSPTQEDLFKALDAAKFDPVLWDSLTVSQCLRYDYKGFQDNGYSYGISAILTSLEELVAKPGWITELAKRTSELDLFGVMTMVRPLDGGPLRRQLLLASWDDSLAAEAAVFAEAYSTPSLGLEVTSLPVPPVVHAFEQTNTDASRKQVQPMLSMFFKSLAMIEV